MIMQYCGQTRVPEGMTQNVSGMQGGVVLEGRKLCCSNSSPAETPNVQLADRPHSSLWWQKAPLSICQFRYSAP